MHGIAIAMQPKILWCHSQGTQTTHNLGHWGHGIRAAKSLVSVWTDHSWTRCWFLCSQFPRCQVSNLDFCEGVSLMPQVMPLTDQPVCWCTIFGSVEIFLEPDRVGTKKVPSTKYCHLMENPQNQVKLSWVGTSGKGLRDLCQWTESPGKWMSRS